MFGEMVGVWLMTALKNYEKDAKLNLQVPAIPDKEKEAPVKNMAGSKYGSKKAYNKAMASV